MCMLKNSSISQSLAPGLISLEVGAKRGLIRPASIIGWIALRKPRPVDTDSNRLHDFADSQEDSQHRGRIQTKADDPGQQPLLTTSPPALAAVRRLTPAANC
jgi:hypothetical protein